MGIIQKIISKHKEKVRARNDMCDNLIMQIDTALQEITIIFSDLQSFVEPIVFYSVLPFLFFEY